MRYILTLTQLKQVPNITRIAIANDKGTKNKAELLNSMITILTLTQEADTFIVPIYRDGALLCEVNTQDIIKIVREVFGSSVGELLTLIGEVVGTKTSTKQGSIMKLSKVVKPILVGKGVIFNDDPIDKAIKYLVRGISNELIDYRYSMMIRRCRNLLKDQHDAPTLIRRCNNLIKAIANISLPNETKEVSLLITKSYIGATNTQGSRERFIVTSRGDYEYANKIQPFSYDSEDSIYMFLRGLDTQHTKPKDTFDFLDGNTITVLGSYLYNGNTIYVCKGILQRKEVIKEVL